MAPSPPKPPRRTLLSDERGHGLRVSWHPERGVTVLSLWRDDVCVGTFRLEQRDMRLLVDFLGGHLEPDETLLEEWERLLRQAG